MFIAKFKKSFCLLLTIPLLSNCGKFNSSSKVTNKQNDSSISSASSSIIDKFIPINDESDLIIADDKILGVKDKSNFHSIKLSDSISEINIEAFSYCFQLEWILISSSVTKIGVNAFYKCSNLSWVVIENPNISISSDAFLDCYSLHTIYLKSDIDTISEQYDFASLDISIVTFLDYSQIDLI